jgi:penicillin-binding protein 1A
MPEVESLVDFHPSLVTRLLDRDGNVLTSYARQRREMLGDTEIPPVLQRAVVAAEDAEFFRHGGVDAFGALRAAMINLQRGRRAHGASTITMQLAKMLYLTPEKSWRRKVEQVLLAVELEKRSQAADPDPVQLSFVGPATTA